MRQLRCDEVWFKRVHAREIFSKIKNFNNERCYCKTSVHVSHHRLSKNDDKWCLNDSQEKSVCIVNSRNDISSTMSQRRSRLFRNHFQIISQMNRLSKLNDRNENLKVIRFLTHFDPNIHNRTQSFIIIINLNDTDGHVAYLVYIMLIVY